MQFPLAMSAMSRWRSIDKLVDYVVDLVWDPLAPPPRWTIESQLWQRLEHGTSWPDDVILALGAADWFARLTKL